MDLYGHLGLLYVSGIRLVAKQDGRIEKHRMEAPGYQSLMHFIMGDFTEN